jgi:hypothetical protein
MARRFILLSLLAAVLAVPHPAAAAEPSLDSPAVFTRATAGSAFVLWANAAVRTDAVLVMYDGDFKPVAQYYFQNAYPTKVELGSLNATGNDVSIESIEISHEGIRLDIGTGGVDRSNGITGTVSFAGRRTHGVLYLLHLPPP